MRSEMPVKGSPKDSISLYHSGKLDCSRFMAFDHEAMKKVSVGVFGNPHEVIPMSKTKDFYEIIRNDSLACYVKKVELRLK